MKLIRPVDHGGYGMDALWNDDFHHTAVVAMTGRNEAYYSDHLGTAQEIVSAVKWGSTPFGLVALPVSNEGLWL